MTDIKIPVGVVVAYGAWALAVGLMATAWAAGSSLLGLTAVLVSMIAATATVRTFIVGLSERMRTAMAIVRTVSPPVDRIR